MFCPSCGTPNRPKARFCSGCGQGLPSVTRTVSARRENTTRRVGPALRPSTALLPRKPISDESSGFFPPGGTARLNLNESREFTPPTETGRLDRTAPLPQGTSRLEPLDPIPSVVSGTVPLKATDPLGQPTDRIPEITNLIPPREQITLDPMAAPTLHFSTASLVEEGPSPVAGKTLNLHSVSPTSAVTLPMADETTMDHGGKTLRRLSDMEQPGLVPTDGTETFPISRDTEIPTLAKSDVLSSATEPLVTPVSLPLSPAGTTTLPPDPADDSASDYLTTAMNPHDRTIPMASPRVSTTESLVSAPAYVDESPSQPPVKAATPTGGLSSTPTTSTPVSRISPATETVSTILTVPTPVQTAAKRSAMLREIPTGRPLIEAAEPDWSFGRMALMGVVVLLLVAIGGGAGWYIYRQINQPAPTAPIGTKPVEPAPPTPVATTSTPPAPTPPPGMVLILAGDYPIGRDAGEYMDKFEKPRHTARLAAFYIDIHEVTNLEYKAFVDQTGHRPPDGWPNGKIPAGRENFPVAGVDASDAEAYATWAGKRLPTEEEWEAAARGIEGRQFPWGETYDMTRLNAVDSKRNAAAPVGSFPSGNTPLGIQDLAGNVWEWTASTAATYPGGETVEAPGQRIIRGGSFDERVNNCTASARNWVTPDTRDARLGFRCVKSF